MASYVRPMEWAQEIGARIREARKARGLTESDLADLLIVHRNTVLNYEAGKGIPNRQMQTIAAVLGIDLKWLLHGDEYEDRLDILAGELAEIRARLDVLATQLGLEPETIRERLAASVEERALLSERTRSESERGKPGQQRKAR